MTYGDFKDLNRRTAADNAVCDKAFGIAKKPKIWWILTWACVNGI